MKRDMLIWPAILWIFGAIGAFVGSKVLMIIPGAASAVLVMLLLALLAKGWAKKEVAIPVIVLHNILAVIGLGGYVLLS